MTATLQSRASATAATRVVDEIRRSGPMRFDRFMDRALYDPRDGYYERTVEQIGRKGDFYTSVSVGSLFGELLAFIFAARLEEIRAGKARLWLVEAGAHDGRLAADILGWFRLWRPADWSGLDYGIVEPSPARRAIQRRRLGAFAGKVHWFGSLAELKGARPSGVLFSNELLDALPLRRFVWRRAGGAGCWRESGVGLAADDTSFIWSESEVPIEEWEASPWLAVGRERLRELEPVLPTGFVWEHPAGAVGWWAEAANCLSQGWVVALDFGRADGLPALPERGEGSLRAFRGHHQVADVLANPGGQDLTADVDFDLIRRVGEAAGLRTAALCPQGRWFGEWLARVEAAVQRGAFPVWDAVRRRGLLTLVHPEHLGSRFQVLIQERTSCSEP
ncbi:MAG: SAM-dependent methyltransferase [Verrucomicrobiales bacterium]|nr:SAM-dependent methyltransferase [Verrucomicrobiales bacterium]